MLIKRLLSQTNDRTPAGAREMNHKQRVQILTALSCLLFPSLAMGESNKTDVRSSLSGDGWNIEFLSEFDQAKTGEFGGLVGAASTCFRNLSDTGADLDTCYEHVRPVFLNTLPSTAESIVLAIDDQNLSQDSVLETLMMSLTAGTVQSQPNLEAHVGLAVYQNWKQFVFEKPVVKMQIRNLGFGVKTKVPVTMVERVTQRHSLPDTFQPFVRWRIVGRDPNE